MPRKNRLIRERAKRLQAQIDRNELVSRTPGGKPLQNQFKGHVRDLARAYTELSIQVLVTLQTFSKSDNIRLLAATTLLERGWGKPAQTIVGDEDNPVMHRHVHEVRRTIIRPKAVNDENHQSGPVLSDVEFTSSRGVRTTSGS